MILQTRKKNIDISNNQMIIRPRIFIPMVNSISNLFIIDYEKVTFQLSTKYKTDRVELAVKDFQRFWTPVGTNGMIVGPDSVTIEHIYKDTKRAAVSTINSDLTESGVKQGETYIIRALLKADKSKSVCLKVYNGDGDEHVYSDNLGSGWHKIILPILSTDANNPIEIYDLNGGYVEISKFSIQKVIHKPKTTYVKNHGSWNDSEAYSGRAIKFNGYGSSVENIKVNNMSKDEVTVCIVATIPYKIDDQYILCQNSIFGSRLYLRTVDLQLQLGLGIDHAIHTNFYPSETTPENIILVAKSGQWTLYVNGVKIEDGEYVGDLPVLGTSFRIASNKYNKKLSACQVSSLYMFNRALSQSEIAKNYSDPTVFLKDAMTDDSCVINMPLTEKGRVVHNLVDYSEGVEMLDSTTTLTGNSDVVGAKLDGNVITRQTHKDDRVTLHSSTYMLEKAMYQWTITVKNVTSSFAKIVMASDYNGWTILNQVELKPAKEERTYTLVGYSSGYLRNSLPIIYPHKWETDISHTVEFVKSSYVKLTGSYQIEDYKYGSNESGFTTGLQTASLELADDGRVLSVADGLNFYGDGFVDTKWIPPTESDFTIEATYKAIPTGTLQQNGCGSGYDGKIHFGILEDNRLYIQSRNNSMYKSVERLQGVMAVPESFHIVMSFDAKNSQVKGYLDGVLVYTFTDSKTQSGMSFSLGARHSNTDSYEFKSVSTVENFKVHNKALTQEEVTTNYEKQLQSGSWGDFDALAGIDLTGFDYVATETDKTEPNERYVENKNKGGI